MIRPRPVEAKRSSVLSVGIILAENFTLSAFSLFVDHLRLAADDGDHSRPILCRWSIMNNKAETVRASCGVSVSRTSGLTDPREFDFVVVIGGLLHKGRQVDDETLDYLRAAAAAKTPLIGICTGVFVLSRAGLMQGRSSCVSWYHSRDFLEEFPDQAVVTDRLFLVDGDRITCSGGVGAADLAGHLIEQRLGRAVAQKASHILLLDRPHRGDEAQPHPPVESGGEGIDDPRVRRALLLMEQNLGSPMTIGSMARRLGLSTRQLERLFQGALGVQPTVHYRMLRLRYARWLLANTARSVTDIALETGFSDCAHFSRQFKAMFAESPSGSRVDKLGIAPSVTEQAGVRLFSNI